MFTYSTPDGRRWLYGGGQPVGIDDELDALLEIAFAHLGSISWRAHSQLWAGAFTGVMVAASVEAIVDQLLEAAPDRAAGITAEQVARLLAGLLTHPGG